MRRLNRRVLSVAVVGAGYWGPQIIRNLQLSESWHLRYVADLYTKRLDRIKRLYPAIKTTRDVELLLSDSSLDVMVIATPPNSHFELARAALEHGKHVLVEKPLAATSREARALCDLARTRGLHLMTDHTFLYTGSVEMLRSLYSSGELGQIYYIDSVRVSLGLFQESNVIWDLGPHDVSILSYLLDENPLAVSVQAQSCVHADVFDVAFLSLKYPSGCIAHVHLSWLSPVKVRKLTIAASKKMVVWDDVEPSEKIHIYDKGIVFNPTRDSKEVQMVSYRLGDLRVPVIDSCEPLSKLINDFHALIADGHRARTRAEFGHSVVEVIEAATESAKSGGKWIKLPRAVSEWSA